YLLLSSFFFFSFLLSRLPPSSTLFPYTTLFRSIWFFLGFAPLGRSVSRTVNFDPSICNLPTAGCLNQSAGNQTFKLKNWQYYSRSEEHTSELQSRGHLVCRLLLEKKKQKQISKT